MKFGQAFKMAFVALKGNKMRSFLTMLGIIIGVLSVVLLISVVDGATNAVTSSVEDLGSNLLSVSIFSPKQTYIDMEDVLSLEDNENILITAPSTNSNATLKSEYGSADATVEGSTEKYITINSLSLSSGVFIGGLDVEYRTYNAIIGNETSEELFGTQKSVGSKITIDGYKFTVIGVLEASDKNSLFTNDNKVIIPITTAQRIFKNKELSKIYVSAQSSETVDAAEKYLDNYMMRSLGNEDYYGILNQSAILGLMDEVLGIMTTLLAAIASISLLVGGIGIMNIMLVSVSERTREIGIRKAIGAQKRDILTQFLIESVTLCIMGGLIGMSLGWLCLQAASALLNMEFVISASTATLALGFSIFVGIAFGMYPANKAANLRPIEALRYE